MKTIKQQEHPLALRISTFEEMKKIMGQTEPPKPAANIKPFKQKRRDPATIPPPKLSDLIKLA